MDLNQICEDMFDSGFQVITVIHVPTMIGIDFDNTHEVFRDMINDLYGHDITRIDEKVPGFSEALHKLDACEVEDFAPEMAEFLTRSKTQFLVQVYAENRVCLFRTLPRNNKYPYATWKFSGSYYAYWAAGNTVEECIEQITNVVHEKREKEWNKSETRQENPDHHSV